MKQLVSNYTFNTINKTITLTDALFSSLILENLLLVTNVTKNTIIYNFADVTSGSATVSGNVITLTNLLASMSNTDKLQIYYDIANPTDVQPVSISSVPLASGSATATNQTSANTILSNIKTDVDKIPSLGQSTMINSVPIVIASDQLNIPIKLQSSISQNTLEILDNHRLLAIDFPNLRVLQYNKNPSPDLSNMNNAHFHNQFNLSVKRGTPELSDAGYFGGWCFENSTDNTQGAQTWLRGSQGGLTLPATANYLIIFADWSWHSWWLYGLYSANFGVDFELANTTFRFWPKWRWVRSIAGVGGPADNKWQFDSSCSDTPTWTDVPSGGQVIPWNEPYKNMWGRFAAVFKINGGTSIYQKFYSQETAFDLSGQTIGSDTVLTEYQGGINQMFWSENRVAGTINQSSQYLQNYGIAIA